MIRGLYTSGWSMLAVQKKMDVISNNMANAGTNGYKKDTMVIESFPDVMTKIIKDYGSKSGRSSSIGTMELGNDVGEVYTYYSQGQLQSTGNYLDMAISGSTNAFFTVLVTDAQGNEQEFYTRDGAFTKAADGSLRTKDGNFVLGENGLIYLDSSPFEVSDDGMVIQNDQVLDRLLIREFQDTRTLRKYGNNLVMAGEDAGERDFSGIIQQGFIELSNVNTIREMVDMITVMRAYEANAKALQAMDTTLDKAVNQVGAVR
jgi:flagellar basal-body rod protein FlgF